MRRVLAWILLPLVALEVVLQAGALLAFWRLSPDSGSGGGTGVLCVGDSIPFGVGRSHESAAYPAQLERLLRDQTGSPWRVVNGGWPGQDSRQTLERLPAQLHRNRPRHVLVTVGMNDLWNRPAALPAPPAEAPAEGFRFELRTARLWRLLRAGGARPAAAAEREPTAVPAELAGTWHMDQVAVAFEPGGVLVAGGAAGRWRIEDGLLFVEAPGLQAIGYRWSRQGDQLVLTGPEGACLHLSRTPPHAAQAASRASGVLQAAWHALAAGDLESAERLGARVADQGEDPELHEFLHFLHRRAGRTLESAEQLAWLQARHRQSPAQPTAEALGRALARDNASGPQLTELTALAAQWPESGSLCRSLAVAATDHGDRALACRAYEQALERRAPMAAHEQADLLNGYAVLLVQDDPPRALRLILEAVRLGAPAMVTRHRLQCGKGRFDRGMLAEAMRALEATAAERNTWPGMFTQALDLAGSLDVLALHLTHMARLCRAQGATLVLVPYPVGHGEIAKTMARVAAQEQIPCLDVAAAFAAARAGRAWSELFTADGHCTDAGYGVLAQVATKGMLAR